MTPRPKTNKWLVTISVTAGTLMGMIDASIVNVAMPHIRGSVGATIEEITWITTGFVIANVLVMPLTGFLGRQFGQKRVYLAALLIFIGGSALCGTARSLEALVIFRVLQGLGAGALQPTEQAILRQTFPPEEQGMAMAVFGVAIIFGPAIGPTLGGYLVDNFSCPWIFYINLPVGLLGFLMVTTFVHEDDEVRAANVALAEKQRRQLDWQGIVLLSMGVATLQYVLEEGARNDWFQSSLVIFLLALSVTALIAFIIRELTAPAPAIDLRLFRDPAFATATVIGFVMFAMLMANMFLLPIFMQELLGFTATQSGWAMMPRAAVMLVMNPLAGLLYNKVPARVMVAWGVIWVAAGSFLMSRFNGSTSTGDVTFAIIVQGVGFAFLFIPLTTAALARIPKHRMADATGLNSLIRQMGGSVGLAVFATLLTRYATQAKAAIGAHLTATRPEVIARLELMSRGMQARGFDPVTARAGALRAMNGMVTGQAMLVSFSKIFLLAGMMFLCILPMLFFLKVPPPAAGAGPREPVHVE